MGAPVLRAGAGDVPVHLPADADTVPVAGWRWSITCRAFCTPTLADAVLWYHAGNLIMAGVLAAGWLTAALVLFRRCGWQS